MEPAVVVRIHPGQFKRHFGPGLQVWRAMPRRPFGAIPAWRILAPLLLCVVPTLPSPVLAQELEAGRGPSIGDARRLGSAFQGISSSPSALGRPAHTLLPGTTAARDPNVHLAVALREVEEPSGWRRGLVIGGLVGVGVGLAVHAVIDAMPCDSCSGTGSESAAEGTRLEFALGFGLLGGALGALIAR